MASWKSSGKVTNICCIGAGYVVSSPNIQPSAPPWIFYW
jgi:hypothetical protein